MQKQNGLNVVIPYVYYYKFNPGNATKEQTVSLDSTEVMV